MCMIDFGCYTNHSLGMSEAADYNKSHFEKGRHYTFVCDRYSVAAFPELDSLGRGINHNLRCGLEIDISYMDRIIPIKCIAVSDKGVENLYRIVGRADGEPLRTEALDGIRDGILIGFSGGYDVPNIREFADFWYLTPSFSERECREIYDAAVRSGKYLCAATNACYVNECDEHKYRIIQSYEELGGFKNRSSWNHMLSESEMFKHLDFLGHQTAWEILIDNPWKLLEPYQDFLCREPYSVRHYIPEAMKSERRKLTEQALPESHVLPCKYEVDIPFPAKAALGAELHDAVYPFAMPSMTHGLYASQEEWCVFPGDFDRDLAKGFATLSPRLLEGHFPVVEIYVDKRVDRARQDTSQKCRSLQCDILSEEQLRKTGKGLSQYTKGSDKIQEIVFPEDFYYKLLAGGVPKNDAIRLADDLRKGLFGAEKYRSYTENFPRRYAHLLAKAGYGEKEIADVLSNIKWLCPKWIYS